ncbi:MAG: PIG-L family deacetylase [Nitrosomonas sp.]|nr:PIG-L family deacetylase [Nitrosomonas sp.]
MENSLIPYQAVKQIPGNCVLVFAPHPDDEVFGCGGAIMRHVELGTPVRVIIVSDGAHGVSEENITEYTRQRQNESIAAAHILGYGMPIFWQYQDRQVCYSEKLIQEILTAIRETGANLVYAPSVFEMHPDHRVMGMAVVEAIRRIGKAVRVALYEVGIPLRPNQLLDISDLAARKTAAMECFVSQNARQRYDQHITALNRYRTYTLPASVTAAEAYIVIPAEELSNDPLKLYQSEHTRQKALGLVLDSSDMPLVSIIIRSMDRPTLSDALDSVALQTYPNIEVVLVNAKGADHREVGEWCGRFPQRIITGEEESPLHRSRAGNVGLRAANGEYLLFLDDDDWLAANHIAKLADALAAHPACSAAHTEIACMDNEKQPTSVIFNHPFNASLLLSSNFMPIHSVLFHRTMVDSGCLMDETLDLNEDWDFWLQVSLHGDFVFVPEISAFYRIHDSSGVHRQEVFSGAAYARIYDKWLTRWPSERLAKLMEDFWNAHAAQRELSNTQTLLTNTQAQLVNTQTQLTDTQIQLADCQVKLDIIYRSRSWRITKPLRQINLMIRSFLNRQ